MAGCAALLPSSPAAAPSTPAAVLWMAVRKLHPDNFYGGEGSRAAVGTVLARAEGTGWEHGVGCPSGSRRGLAPCGASSMRVTMGRIQLVGRLNPAQGLYFDYPCSRKNTCDVILASGCIPL